MGIYDKKVPVGEGLFNISKIGLGSWAFGGDKRKGWPQDERDSANTIHKAILDGINWIDTAPSYGLGQAEEVVGRAIKKLSTNDRPFIFSKCGPRWSSENYSGPMSVKGAETSIREEVEHSLRRLQIDHLDVLMMHCPAEDGTPIEEYWMFLNRLKEEGKVRAIGLSNHDKQLIELAHNNAKVDIVQPGFSMMNREDAENIIPYCFQNNICTVTYSPLYHGLLTGNFTKEKYENLPKTDWRTKHFTLKNVREIQCLIELLRRIAENSSTSITAVVLSWVLQWPGISAIIAGARTPDQLDDWKYSNLPKLDSNEILEINTLLATQKLGLGPTSMCTESSKDREVSAC